MKREWQDENLLEKFKYNSRYIYYSSLALENYFDNKAENKEQIDKAFNIINNYRENLEKLQDTELVELTDNIVNELKSIYKVIDNKNFEFYDDGTIYYHWDKKKKEKNNEARRK